MHELKVTGLPGEADVSYLVQRFHLNTIRCGTIRRSSHCADAGSGPEQMIDYWAGPDDKEKGGGSCKGKRPDTATS